MNNCENCGYDIVNLGKPNTMYGSCPRCGHKLSKTITTPPRSSDQDKSNVKPRKIGTLLD